MMNLSTSPRLTWCRRCVLTSAVPGISFDETGLCSICQKTPPEDSLAEQRAKSQREMEDVIEKTRGARPYDCVVAFSGGKDSSYVLKTLVETYKLSCLAVTIDNGFLSRGVVDNCKAVCGALGVDHIMFTPKTPFMTAMYRKSATSEAMHPKSAIQRASSICNSCIGVINTHMLRIALQQNIPIIAGGYIGGQLPKDTAYFRINLKANAQQRAAAVKRFVGHFGDDAADYFGLPPNAADRDVVVINPMLGLMLREDEIIETIGKFGWTRPTDTGVTSTNCRLNDLGVYIHSRRHGFHPYIFEMADQVRHGLLERDAAISKLRALPEYAQVEWIADKLGVGHNEI